MLVIGMATLFAGYTVASYGWVLIKGWDISFREWISPLNPYTWPAGGGDPSTVDPSKLFPGSKSTSGSSGGATAASPDTLT